MDAMQLGSRIRSSRKACKLTSEQLAAMVDISATHLRQIECGNRLPSLPCLVAISNALKVSPSVLLQDGLTEVYDEVVADFVKKFAGLSTEGFLIVSDTIDTLLKHIR